LSHGGLPQDAAGVDFAVDVKCGRRGIIKDMYINMASLALFTVE
jgi:hypothetical protein